MSQDFLSQDMVDAILKGEPRDSAVEESVRRLERAVRYPEDGAKLTKQQVMDMLAYEEQRAVEQMDTAIARRHAYRYALELVGALP